MKYTITFYSETENGRKVKLDTRTGKETVISEGSLKPVMRKKTA